jgi:hypothetical protein
VYFSLAAAANRSIRIVVTVSAGDGKWEVAADLSAWADPIAGGTVKRVEIAVTATGRADRFGGVDQTLMAFGLCSVYCVYPAA